MKTITVTSRDLIAGAYLDNEYCPLALAIRRVFPNAKRVYVYIEDFEVDHRFFVLDKGFKYFDYILAKEEALKDPNYKLEFTAIEKGMI